MSTSLQVNFRGLLNEITLPEYKSLWPLFEAIVNSIQSINDSIGVEKGNIQIKATRIGQEKLKDFTNSPYNDFEITDNGAGFTSQNYSSFLEAYSELKITKGCKGLGRFLWLKAFDRVEIESVFYENNQYFKRFFEFNERDFIKPENNVVPTTQQNIYTKVRLIGFKNKYQKNCSVNIEPIAKKIIEHCMMYFISNSCPQIILSDEDEKIDINDYFNSKVKDSLHRDDFELSNHIFSIYHIQMNESASKHELHLCASNREVESISLSKKIPNLNTRLTDEQGNEYYYVGYLTGDYLDSAVNTNRTAFYIDEDSNLTNTILKNDIINNSLNFIKIYLGEDLNKVKEKKKEQIDRYVRSCKPQYKFLLNQKPEVYDDIPSGLKNDDLDIELHKQTQKWEKELKELGKAIEQKNRETYDSVADFDKIFKDYCSGITNLNKASLSEYVIRRKTILDLFSKALEMDENDKYKKEDIIHSLICPMQHTSDNIPFNEMNLWIIDEKLSYHKFLASDTKLKSIPVINSKSEDRVDIAIFDQAISYSSEKDHFNSISIIELKRPGRNDYSAGGKDRDPIEQVLRYVKQIREGKATLANGRDFGNVENTPFYCYIVADLTGTLRDRAETSGYTKTPDGEGYYGYNPNRNAFVEIISYSKLLSDAQKSNQVLFDKLFSPQASEVTELTNS